MTKKKKEKKTQNVTFPLNKLPLAACWLLLKPQSRHEQEALRGSAETYPGLRSGSAAGGTSRRGTQHRSDTMAVCRRRNRPKLLFCLLCVTFVGYLVFSGNSSSDVGATGRRGAPVESPPGDGDLRRPVYEKPPVDWNAPGEMGRAVRLTLSEEEKRKEEESLQKHQINIYVSDKVSLHRRLPEKWNPR